MVELGRVRVPTNHNSVGIFLVHPVETEKTAEIMEKIGPSGVIKI